MFEELHLMFSSKLVWCLTVITGIYLYLKFVTFSYWKRKGIPYVEPIIPFGNLIDSILERDSFGNVIKRSYEKLKNHRFHGMYMLHNPALIINDPELVRLILIKEFNRFPDRGFYCNKEVDPLAAHLFFQSGEEWKRIRAKLSPAFTSGKLKQMFPTLAEVGIQLSQTVSKILQETDILDVKELASRYTADSISLIAFGINPNALKNPDNDFRRYGNMAVFLHPVRNAIFLFAPKIMDLFRIPIFPMPVRNFFTTLFTDTINYRRRENIVRKDFIDLLMKLIDAQKDNEETEKGALSKEKFGLLEACAQSFVMFFGGYETTSSTITYFLYEIAFNPEIQRKLQEEVDDVINRPEGLSYENIIRMEYLDMAFCELLRKHPPVPTLNRICVEDFDIPDSDFRIPKGMPLIVSLSGMQRDPRIFPEPDTFDPLRFSKENSDERKSFVYQPFGDGPRMCIGNRFAIMQVKIALFHLLSKYTFSVCNRTCNAVKYTKLAFSQTPDGPIYLKIESRM